MSALCRTIDIDATYSHKNYQIKEDKLQIYNI